MQKIISDTAKEFEKKFFVRNGELTPETYLDVKNFLLTKIRIAYLAGQKSRENY